MSTLGLQWKRFAMLSLLSIIIFIAGLNTNLIESAYSAGFYGVTSVIQRSISTVIPFALGDFLYLLLIFFTLRNFYRFYKKIKAKTLTKEDRIKIPLQAVNFLLILYLAFKILWGLNYSRPSVSKQLNISDDKYTTAQLVSLGEFFIEKLNELDSVKKTRFNISQLQTIAKEGYDKMALSNTLFRYRVPSLKPVLNSWLITKIGIEGYYSPLSGEANVNMRLPTVALPFVTCHEIAHQLGIAREDEANLIGYLVASHSDNAYFRYSAAYAMLKSILYEIRIKSPKDYENLYKTIHSSTLLNFKNDRDFWRMYNNQMFGYLDVAFDRFLKLNNQRKGTDSYQDIVLWLYNYHKDDLTNK
ncbi:DUF3810 domain-containing protein [Pedobacter frigoris]|uniref:DUF3810 domain-containing protein n=1 Tax=Pedobacter frigoris TaxID=2571272 RepID=A0A4U1CS71_9SPHI|nr:DUF3810 domain-containing protein [Pedobacter frigoris]TKC08749.1 DUF3810 domain-containing protein [Pedobacter frigoris]